VNDIGLEYLFVARENMNHVFRDFCRIQFLQLDFVLQTPILAQLCGEPGASLRWQEVVELDDVRWLAREIFQELYLPVDIPVSQLQGVPEMKSHFFIYAPSNSIPVLVSYPT
jgi:hypothetical protein